MADAVSKPRKTEKPKCTGHSSQTGKPCGNWPMKGLTVCRSHGGSAPQAKRAGKRRVQEQAAKLAAAAYGLPREIDASTALLEELWRTAGHIAWLNERIAVLDELEMHGPVGGGEHSEPREEPHVWIRLYQEERAHLTAVAATCSRVGIEERRVQLAEQQAQLIAQFARGLMADLGIDPASEPARAAFRKHLTLVAGGAAG